MPSFDDFLRFGEGRRLKRLAAQADYVATLEPDFEGLSDADLAAKTAEFRQRLDNGEPLDDLVFEAYAAVREAGKRALGQRIFDVQPGLRAALIQNMMPFDARRAAYEADITYGTNSEFGFDYLRDNMAVSLDGVVQRGHVYGIVDEVDSILIDEARTPLIISGEPETAAKIYYDFARVVRQLEGHASKPGDPKDAAEQAGADYEYDEKHKTVS